LRENLESEIRKNLLDPKEGLYGTERKGFNECVSIALRKSFEVLDEYFY
jgi:hypothetical protein